MTKSGGLGDRLFIDGYNVSGDIASIDNLSCPMTVQQVPGINDSAQARIGLTHDGLIGATVYWNPGNSVGNEIHNILKALPSADRHFTYLRGTTLGDPAASLVCKQANYDGNRAQDGSFTLQVAGQANAWGLDWGVNLTAGERTDTTAGNGSTVDLGSSPTSYSQGWTAYLHVTAFTGTSVTVKMQDSADASSWTDLSGGAFTASTAIDKQRLASASITATVRRYVRVVTTGTFSNAKYVVNFVRYEAAGHA